MPDRIDRAVKTVIAAAFVPEQLFTTRRLSVLAWVLIAVLLVGTVALSEPHVRDFVAGTVFNTSCIPAAVKERGQEYCDFATIAFTLLIAGVIGGIFVTDDVVAATQTRMRLFEDAQTHTLRQDQRALMRAMYKAYLRSKNVGRGMTVWNFPKTIWRSVGAAYDLYSVAGHRLPLFYFVMIPLRFGSAFPKGLYGLLALVLFEGLLASQVAKAFFEYYPACRS